MYFKFIVFKFHHVTYEDTKFYYAIFYSNLCKKHESSTHFYIHDTFIISIRSFINQSRFTRSHDHSIPISSTFSTPFHSFHSRLQEREKILKFASYFCYSTFLQWQEKKTFSISFDEKLHSL